MYTTRGQHSHGAARARMYYNTRGTAGAQQQQQQQQQQQLQGEAAARHRGQQQQQARSGGTSEPQPQSADAAAAGALLLIKSSSSSAGTSPRRRDRWRPAKEHSDVVHYLAQSWRAIQSDMAAEPEDAADACADHSHGATENGSAASEPATAAAATAKFVMYRPSAGPPNDFRPFDMDAALKRRLVEDLQLADVLDQC